MNENDPVGFFAVTFERKELEQKFKHRRVSPVEANRNMYDFTSNGVFQNLTSGHVTSRSSKVKIGKNAYHSTRLDELNTMRPHARLYQFSVRSYSQ